MEKMRNDIMKKCRRLTKYSRQSSFNPFFRHGLAETIVEQKLRLALWAWLLYRLCNREGCEDGCLKKCSFCETYIRTDLPVPQHKCNANHDGSSGLMESTLCRQMLEEVMEKTNIRVSVGTLVTDDDSTWR